MSNDDISTNPCLNNLNEILKSFIDNLKNDDERQKYKFLAELLENADLPLNTKVNSILQIINVMKKQAEEKMKDNQSKQDEQNKLIETKKRQLKEVR